MGTRSIFARALFSRLTFSPSALFLDARRSSPSDASTIIASTSFANDEQDEGPGGAIRRDVRNEDVFRKPARDPWSPPHGWVGAPPVGALVADVFVPSKTPLDERWFREVPPERRYTPEDALRLASRAAGGRKVELVIDLTNSNRYYDPAAFEKKGAAHVKVACVGKDAPPDAVAVSRFVYEASKFLAERSRDGKGKNGVILVHCTHGFNRTGAALVHYMQRTRPWPKLNEHLAEFAAARPSSDAVLSSSAPEPAPCGIYKPEYIQSLFDEYLERRFRTTAAPPTPAWKLESSADEGSEETDAPPVPDSAVPADDLFGASNPEYLRTSATSRAPRPGGDAPIGSVSADAGDGALGDASRRTTAGGNLDGSRMHHDDVLGEVVFEGQAREIRNVVLWLCGQEGSRFPGSQPVSLARDNMHELARREYHVTWKADGTRYMLLCMRDGAYLVDRKFAVRRVVVRFPAPLKTHGVATHNATLLDGEMVVDDLPDGTQRRRFLVYDCVAALGEKLVDKPFVERYALITRSVVDPRSAFLAEAGKSGSYDFSKEPFSVRRKDFAPIAGTEKFVREFIPKLTHECDGLIFQPSRARYENGTMPHLLKWKFTHLNSVDFLLRLERGDGGAARPRLFVGGERDTLVEVREPSGRFALRGSHEDGDGDEEAGAGTESLRDVAADGSTLRSLDGRIVECAWDKVARFAFDDDSEGKHESGAHTTGAWRYMRVRSDKDAPNFVTVYKHTLQSILDDITEDEIVDFVGETLARRRSETADAGLGYAPPV